MHTIRPHLYRPAGLPTAPSEYREHNERVVALIVHCCRGRVVEAARLRSLKARLGLQLNHCSGFRRADRVH